MIYGSWIIFFYSNFYFVNNLLKMDTGSMTMEAVVESFLQKSIPNLDAELMSYVVGKCLCTTIKYRSLFSYFEIVFLEYAGGLNIKVKESQSISALFIRI